MGRTGQVYRRIRARVSDIPTGFVWIEDKKIAASGYPASRRQVEWVVRQGIGSIVTLTEAPLPSAWTDLPGLVTTHIAMQDHMPPSQESLDAAAEQIHKDVAAGRSVLVHCLAGRGRTMCALGAYLIRYEGLGAKLAIDRLRRAREDAVEPGQEGSLLAYAKTNGQSS